MTKTPYDQLYIYEIAGDARDAVNPKFNGYLGLWLEESTSFVFFSRPADIEISQILKNDSNLTLLDRHFLTYEQWQGGMELAPIVLEDLAVLPAWGNNDQKSLPQNVLRLDPGLVFGNGLHPTTRHSLELLNGLAQIKPLGKVFDLGCGTGILGLSACLLGADSVLAVDLNPLCVTTTINNAQLNNLSLEVKEASATEFVEKKADLVLANVHWEIQEQLWNKPSQLSSSKDLILSGITRSQVNRLEDLVIKRGYKVEKRLEAESTWFTLWCRK